MESVPWVPGLLSGRAATWGPRFCAVSCLDVTDQGQPVLPKERLSHPPLPKLSSQQSVDSSPPAPSSILVVSLTQSFLSPSSLRASAGLTSQNTLSLCPSPDDRLPVPPVSNHIRFNYLRLILIFLPNGSPGQFL